LSRIVVIVANRSGGPSLAPPIGRPPQGPALNIYRLQVQGGTVEEYIIPDEKKAEVLEKLYLFRPIPSLDDELYAIFSGAGNGIRTGDLQLERLPG